MSVIAFFSLVGLTVGGAAGTGSNDGAMSRTLSGSLPYDLYDLWEFSSGSALSIPVAANGMVYVGDARGTMYALDGHSGEINWTFEAQGRIRQQAAVTLGAVYFAAGDLTSGRLYAVNAWDGNLRWSYEFTGSMVGAPVVQHPLVYFGYNSQRGNITALSVFDGVREWTREADHYLSGQLAVRDDVVVYGTTLTENNKSQFYCVDSGTGTLVWDKTLGGYFSGVSLLDGEQAVISSGGASTGRIYGVDVNTGDELWPPFRVRTFNFWSPPSVHEGSIYVLNKGIVYALDLNTGQERWSRSLPVHDHEGPLPFSHAPLSTQEHLYITYAYADSRLSQLYVLGRHQGNLLAVHETGMSLVASPTVRGRNLYLIGQEGRLLARRGLKVTVNGRAMAPAESGAFIREGTTHVALRPLLETAGFTIVWNGDSRSVTARKGEHELLIQVDGQEMISACGKSGQLPLQLLNDRLMVAARPLVEFMGGQIRWDADIMSVSCQLP